MSLKAALVAILALTATVPAHAEVLIEGQGAIPMLVLLSLAVTTTTTLGKRTYDVNKAEALLDQAYAGRGEKLELLATAAKRPVEDIVETIIALDKAGKLDTKNPEAMAKTIAAALK